MQLIRSHYLQGRHFLDMTHAKLAASWVWDSVKHGHSLLRKGACFQIGRNSSVRIKEEPWIPKLETFRVPIDIPIPEELLFVRDLMLSDRASWDRQKIKTLFPSRISSVVLNTPISEREQDIPIWTPSLHNRAIFGGIYLPFSATRKRSY